MKEETLRKNLTDFNAYAAERKAYGYDHTGMVLDNPIDAANLFTILTKYHRYRTVEIKDEFGKYAVIAYFNKNIPEDKKGK